jgi:hypothetical protein
MKLSKLFNEFKNETIEVYIGRNNSNLNSYTDDIKIKINGKDYTKKLKEFVQTINQDGYWFKIKMGD